jgi:hypothetical protein
MMAKNIPKRERVRKEERLVVPDPQKALAPLLKPKPTNED